MNFRLVILSLLAALSIEASAAYPTVSNVSAVQRWPVSSDVDVWFTVNDDGDNCDFDLVATWQGQTAGKTIGTVFAPGPGRQHYVWHTESLKMPAHDCSDIYDPDPERYRNCIYKRPETKFAELSNAPLKGFRVEVRPAKISDRMFMCIHLKDGTVSYGKEKTFVNLKSTAIQSDCLVFRRVRAKDDFGKTIVYTNGYSEALNHFEFPMADGSWKSIKDDAEFAKTYGGQYQLREVTFSADYFISVFLTTSGQLHYMYRNASYFVGCNSVNQRSYDQLRGTLSEGINWPWSGFKVSPNSDIAHFREFLKPFVGNMILDLPTRAQLETAMRAGTDGNQILAPDPELKVAPITTAMAGDGAAISNAFNSICIWTGSVPSLYADNENVAHAGANAWGLYDVVGLYKVWTLDTDYTPNGAGLDPVGSWRTEKSFESDANRRQTMSYRRTNSDLRRFVPGIFEGMPVERTNSSSARFVLNTKDWMADRTK